MTLHEIGLKHGTDKATYHGYTSFYERHLSDLRTGSGILLELGVHKGQSLAMWKEWAPDLTVIGWDITQPLKVAGCFTMRVDCSSVDQMRMNVSRLSTLFRLPIRAVIDDASHRWADQRAAFTALWPETPNFVMEDIHTSTRAEYGAKDVRSPYNRALGFDLDFQVETEIKTFERREDDSWTAIFRKVSHA